MAGLIDTHTHLDSFFRKGELPGVVARAAAAGVEAMIAIGTDDQDWTLNRTCAQRHPGVVEYTVGLHPCNVTVEWRRMLQGIERYWEGKDGPPPVALGECGLDRFHLPPEPEASAEIFARQKEAFACQLQVAKALACPVVVHSRGAFGDCLEMIQASGVAWEKIVLHCFSEGPAEIIRLNGLGGYGSFTGILTYKNAGTVRAAAIAQGLPKLMVETDAPYLAPVPNRGKPNEPAWVRYTAEAAANLFGVPYEALAEATTATARRFFGF